ncbi:MAG TPA: sigma-70 family RNA polymerase sigma factor [Azospirillaceae bacterium]|nr:sigma-70 family RNA polymerase sigma factor [Azospirillaceae bacterium]
MPNLSLVAIDALPPALTPQGSTPRDCLSADVTAIALSADRQAFARLFAHFAPRIKGYMTRQGLSPARSEDLAQETMLTVWRKAALFDPARADAATWIFTIARNLRIDAQRREGRPTAPEESLAHLPDHAPPADAVAAAGQTSRRVRAALKELPEDQAEVVRLSFFLDLAHPAIAEKLNLPLGTVKSRLRLAMGKMRKALGEEP